MGMIGHVSAQLIANNLLTVPLHLKISLLVVHK